VAGAIVLVAVIYVRWVGVHLLLSPPKRAVGANFSISTDQGNFGELLTAIILTQQGWRQLPSKLGGGGQGIDGLFVQPRRFGFAVLMTETKTNGGKYEDRQLEAGKLIRTIGELYVVGEIDWPTADEIIRGMRYRSPYIRKECWRHMLDGGQTIIRRADRNGILEDRTKISDNKHLMESLTMMLAIFDREGRYIKETT
jgi:hypothetical protein